MSSIPARGARAERGGIWPGVKAVIEKRKAETFAAQAWHPICGCCGERGPELSSADAGQWWADHKKQCP